MSIHTRPALFLDRDGVINIDQAYVYRPDDFHFIDGIFELVAAANRLGYLVVVVTNQAGIGRGYYTEADFHALTDWMLGQFEQRGAKIDAVYFCPDHPEHGVGKYRRDSPFRKPAPGMLLQAAEDLIIDLAQSIIVGDKDTDMQSGMPASVGCMLRFRAESAGAVTVSHLGEVLPYLKSATISAT